MKNTLYLSNLLNINSIKIRFFHSIFFSTFFFGTIIILYFKKPEFINKYYLFFSVISFLFYVELLINSKLFSQKLMGIIFFIGFWIKFHYNIISYNGIFPEYFNQNNQFGGATIINSTALLDKAEIIISFFFLAIILAKKFLFEVNFSKLVINFDNLVTIYKFIYKKYFFLIVLFFLFFIYFNFIGKFYLRGLVPQINNFLIISIYKFYFEIFFLITSSLLLDIYIKKTNNYLSIFLIFLFICLNFLFSFSRLVVLLCVPLFLALCYYVRNDLKFFNDKKILYFILSYIILSFLFLKVIGNIRYQFFFADLGADSGADSGLEFSKKLLEYSENPYKRQSYLLDLIIQRFPGIDALLSVLDSNKGLSFVYFIKQSTESVVLTNKLNFVFIPGPCAYFYKSGSIIFLFSSTFLSASIIFHLENIFNNIFKNKFFVNNMFSFLLAYKFTHIGLGGLNSILFYTSLLALIFLIYFLANKVIIHNSKML